MKFTPSTAAAIGIIFLVIMQLIVLKNSVEKKIFGRNFKVKNRAL